MPFLPAVARRARRSPFVFDLAGMVVAAAGGAVVVIWTLKLWRIHPHVPFIGGGDSDLTMAALKTLDRHAWYYWTDRLGAPFGQNVRDFPAAADSLNLLYAKTLGLFTDSPGLMVNMFFFGSYPLIAASGYVGSRVVGLRRPISVFVGVAYAAEPFHRFRFTHLFLANYAVLPLAAALIIRQAGPRPLLRPRRDRGMKGMRHRDSLVAIAIIVCVATSGIYYAVFTCLFLALSSLLGLLRRRRAAAVLGVAAIGMIGLLVVLQLLPTILYARSNGSNDIVTRSLIDLDNYPLRPSVMLLPVVGHQLPAVRDWRDAISSPTIPSEGFGEAVGFVAAFGFGLCLVLIVLRFTSQRIPRWSRRILDAPLYVVFGVLTASYSGFEVLLGSVGFTQIRAWNRISIFLAFFCLLTAAALISPLLHQRKRLAIALLPMLLFVAVWDQTTITSAPDYEAAARSWADDGAFYGRIESTLDPSANVFQLPIANFPEQGPIVDMVDYRQMAGYLHTEDVRWSYGGVKGREGDWRLRLDPYGPEFLNDLLITGFTGLTVNLDGYADRGTSIDAALINAGAVAGFDSPSGDTRFYDLRPLRAGLDASRSTDAQLARRTVLLDQPDIRFGSGFYGPENPGGLQYHWAEPSASFTMQGAVPRGPDARVRLNVRTYAKGEWTLTVDVDGTSYTFEISDVVSDIDVPVDLAGSPLTFRLRTDAPVDDLADPRNLDLELYGLPTVLLAGTP